MLYISRDGLIVIQRMYKFKRKYYFLSLKIENTIPFIFFIKKSEFVVWKKQKKCFIIVKNHIYGRKIYSLMQK